MSDANRSLKAAVPQEVRVTWHDHEPKPGEGRDDLLLLLNRGDWSVPWVRREMALLLAERTRYKAALERLTNPMGEPKTEEAVLVQIEVAKIAEEAL